MAMAAFHVAMFPWFAMGHLTPYLNLSNKLAERGHRVSFLVPMKTQSRLQHLNHHPSLITFIPLTIPHVEGLPLGAETMSDVPIPMAPLLGTALDLIKYQVETILQTLKPEFVFFDLAHWIPAITRPLGIKPIYYAIVTASFLVHFFVPSRKLKNRSQFTEIELMNPAEGYPLPLLKLRVFEARSGSYASFEFGIGVSFHDRLTTCLQESEAICFRSCREIDGPFCDFMETQYMKQMLFTGPVLIDPVTVQLEERWAEWLGRFKEHSVVYCALGSECVLEKDQFHELVLGLETAGYPFLAALKVPFGAASMEAALPEGFEDRVKGRGVVYDGWVQQQMILKHPSVGSFVSHAGPGSMWESLSSDCQIVLLPHRMDQFINSKIMANELKVAVEVERREEDGWFSSEDVCQAVKLVMDEDNEVGREVSANHKIWKDLMLSEGFESLYISNFIMKLQGMLVSNGNK